MKKNDGGPAFPRPMSTVGDGINSEREVELAQEGMTLRDYFAGQALAGPAAPDWAAWNTGRTDNVVDKLAANAYAIADAMLAERDR